MGDEVSASTTPAAPKAGFASAAASGSAWTTLQTVGNKLVTVFAMLVLARLLTPAEFGLANLAASIGLANGHYAAGELGPAAEALRRASERHPESVAVLNNLAQTLSDLGRNDEALPLIERAVALEGPLAGAARETREQILKRLQSSSPGKP